MPTVFVVPRASRSPDSPRPRAMSRRESFSLAARRVVVVARGAARTRVASSHPTCRRRAIVERVGGREESRLAKVRRRARRRGRSTHHQSQPCGVDAMVCGRVRSIRARERSFVRSFVRVSGGGAERGGATRARRTRTHSSQFGSFSSRAYTGRSCMCANVRAVSSALCPRPLARERDAPCPSRHRVLALGGDDGGLSGGVAARADARRIASYSSSDFNSMVGERFRSLAAGAAREDVVVVSPSARRHRSVGRRGAASARIQTTSGRSARASVDATRATRDSARESTRRKNIHPPIHPSAGAYLESSRARAVCRRRAGRCPFRVGAIADRVDGYVCLKHTTVR